MFPQIWARIYATVQVGGNTLVSSCMAIHYQVSFMLLLYPLCSFPSLPPHLPQTMITHRPWISGVTIFCVVTEVNQRPRRVVQARQKANKVLSNNLVRRQELEKMMKQQLVVIARQKQIKSDFYHFFLPLLAGLLIKMESLPSIILIA